jgi:hypothetical protein
MLKIKRRNFLHGGVAIAAAPWTAILQIGCSPNHPSRAVSTNNLSGDQSTTEDNNTEKGNTMRIHYLEVVTPHNGIRVAGLAYQGLFLKTGL